jgi:hypothetical protein
MLPAPHPQAGNSNPLINADPAQEKSDRKIKMRFTEEV